ncbi:Piso0_005360 [Millerozyma farinosa CBS 7064]|uniref:V-type proton ATPase subunit C n=1 Tax=Pichia sorbitophila (strain ATCC MYA-4447 / BCRC 22081 / CBS 7064 / NBRC 10061 / NRRL Y-12695) TaxID=559304 RepID=G8Y1Z0_PICSO|nr:Piso0_005360 [Millerozyma farinosa CBS 7064]
MEPLAKYFALSLPQSVNAQEWLENELNGGKVPLYNLKVPDFQIGTLDSLVQESEELGKLDSQLAGSVAKIVEILESVTETSSARSVQGRDVLDYLENFNWNSSKYRLGKSIIDLVRLISNEALTLDGDVRAAYQSYQNAKSNFLAADRKRNGDLSIKSLHEIVKPEHFVLDSENLTSVLVAVPKNLVKEFKDSYETITQFVIPRSAIEVAHDQEYFLYSVTLFKKYEQDFINQAREQKWHPRTDFVYSEENLNNLRKEFDLSKATEVKSKNDLIRLTKTAYSEIFAALIHIKVIRVYVESVLRYGLPPQFDYYLVKFDRQNLKNFTKAKKELLAKFGYLGGHGFSNNQSLHEYASLVDTEYEPFVLYEINIV